MIWVGAPRTAYVYKSGVCFADGLLWVVGLGRLEHLDVWMPSDVGGVVAGCREAVVSGAVHVVKLMTARGAEASVVFAKICGRFLVCLIWCLLWGWRRRGWRWWGVEEGCVCV